MLTDREKAVVGVCLVVVLAAAVTGGVVWLASGKNPSQGSSNRTAVSTLPKDTAQQSAAQEEGQQQSSTNSSGSQTTTSPSGAEQDSGTPADNGSIAGEWVLDMQGASSALPGLSLSLNQSGGLTMGGAEASFLKLKEGRYTFDPDTRNLKIKCVCQISASPTASMTVDFDLSGQMNAGLTEADGTFTATISGTAFDRGTFKLHH